MKKAVVIPAALAIALAFGTAGFAKDGAKKVFQPSGNVALKYWMADLSTSGVKADQNFFPEIDVEFSPSPGWTGVVQYANSNTDAISPADPPDNTRAKTTKLLFGVRYDVSDMAYVSLGYDNNRIDMPATTGDDALKYKGFRIGGGAGMKFPGSGWSANVDLGFGLGGDVEYSWDTANADGSAFDADLTLSYKTAVPRLKADVGYRYYKFKGDATATTNAMTFKYKGPHIGVSMDF